MLAKLVKIGNHFVKNTLEFRSIFITMKVEEDLLKYTRFQQRHLPFRVNTVVKLYSKIPLLLQPKYIAKIILADSSVDFSCEN